MRVTLNFRPEVVITGSTVTFLCLSVRICSGSSAGFVASNPALYCSDRCRTGVGFIAPYVVAIFPLPAAVSRFRNPGSG